MKDSVPYPTTEPTSVSGAAFEPDTFANANTNPKASFMAPATAINHKAAELSRHSDLFFANWNRLLATSEGRDRFLKLLQTTCQLFAALFDYARQPWTWAVQLRLLKGQEAFSNVRKAFCLFDFGADVEKLVSALREERLVREPLDTCSILCSLWTNLSDHYVWAVRNGLVNASDASLRSLMRVRDRIALLKCLAILGLLGRLAIHSLRQARDMQGTLYLPARVGSYKTLPPRLQHAPETLDANNRNADFVRVTRGVWLHPLLRLRMAEQLCVLCIALHNVGAFRMPNLAHALLGLATCFISVYLRWPR